MPVPPIPWDKILQHGPQILDAAKTMWNRWDDRPKPDPVGPNTEVRTQIAALEKRLRALEEMEAAQAQLVKDMAEQMQMLTRGLAELSQTQTDLSRGLEELDKRQVTRLDQLEAKAAQHVDAQQRSQGRLSAALWLAVAALGVSIAALATALMR